jgi:rod shape-determining protein MreC
LKSQNDALAIENARLKSVLFATTDSISITKLEKRDKQPYDVVSKVIHNSYNVHENYLTSGALQGVESDMGVI